MLSKWADLYVNLEKDVPSRLSSQWLCCNACTWAHDVHQTIHHVPKCMSCLKAIMVITRRAHCLHPFHLCEFYIYIYVYNLLNQHLIHKYTMQ